MTQSTETKSTPSVPKLIGAALVVGSITGLVGALVGHLFGFSTDVTGAVSGGAGAAVVSYAVSQGWLSK